MKKLYLATWVFLALCLSCFNSLNAQTLAFPGAEGFGKYATGGRSGSVYHVTNLNNSGAGSLRDAVSVPNRIVVFDVAGVIRISERMIVSSNIYLAGQTAPGEGITVYGNGWSFTKASNTICRYMKIRMGIVGSSGVDANGLSDGHDIIFDHCSVSWGRDENFSINSTTAQNVTIQNSIISQGLLTHSAGGLIQCDGGITLYRNLYADNGTRNNKVKGVSQYVNNIVYNWSAGAYIMGGESSGSSYVNVTNNCFIQGPTDGVRPLSSGNSTFHIYAADNIYDKNRDGVFNPYTIPQSEYEGPPDFQAAPYSYPALPTIPANTLTSTLLPTVGASLPYRDLADYYVVNEVKSFGIKGELIASEAVLPFGAPTSWSLWAGTARTDTDNDGMPNSWETANGTNPSVNDAMVITASGYTNIENYINSIDGGNSQDYLRTPLKLKQDSATQNTLYISWLDYTEKEQGYIIERKINGTWTQIGTTGVDVNYFTLTGLQPEESATLRVKAYNATKESGYSNELVAKTKPIEAPVLDPASFTPDLTWTGAVSQNWDKTSNNWLNVANAPSAFTDSSKLLFPEADAGKTVNIAAQMGANDILVNSNGNYTFSGPGYIAGSKSLNKTGNGILSLLTNNTYTGSTVLRAGTIELNKLANGGLASSIGASPNYNFNWVWKGGKWAYTGGTVSTDRNASIDATTEFNVSNSSSIVTFTGTLSGEGGLVKSGPGKLVLKNANPYAGETIIKGGTIEVSPVSSATEADDIINDNQGIGTSNILRLQNGTYKTTNGSTTIYENYPLELYVADNTINGFEPYRNANLSMNVHGNGTLNYAVSYLRELIQGDWSDFTGTLYANGINTTDGSILMIDNGTGFPSNRIVTTGNTKIATYQNNKTIYLGGLSGNAGTMLSCGGSKTASFGNGFTTYVVGAAGTNETFNGVINNHLYANSADGNGTTTIVKEGEGLWRLNGTNTHIGTTTITGGKLILNGTNTGTGKVTANEGTILAGKGSIAAAVDVAGTLEPGDSSISTFTLKDKLTLQSTAITSVDINKSSNTWDKISVTSNIAYDGTLKINFTGTPASGDVFKIFTTSAAVSGTITQFDPATPGPGLLWKFKEATGELAIQSPNFVEAPTNLTLNAPVSIGSQTSTVNCTWIDKSDNEDYFILERGTDGVNFVDVAHPAANATTFSDDDLSAGTKYYYRIKAHSPLNESVYSAIAFVTTPSATILPTVPASPSPATNATNVFLNGNTINLAWASNYADTYEVYLGTSSNTLSKVAEIPSTTSTYSPPTLDRNTQYYWRIDAKNANGTTTGTVWNFKTANIPATVAGDYRTVASGNWGSSTVTTAIWEVFNGTAWTPTSSIPSGSTPTVTVRTGHTVRLNATTSVNNLVIQSGATFLSGTSDGATGTAANRNLRVISSINNFGTVGSSSTSTDRINFEGYKDNGTIYLTGTSTYYINTFIVNAIAVNTEVLIDANVNLASYMRGNYSNSVTGANTAGQDDDNITITINTGRTVTMGGNSYLQEGSSPTNNTITNFGKYTYNINGTLDMKATGTSCIVAHSTKSASNITINVNGTWLTGNAMRLASTSATAGSINANIGADGVVDAGARATGSSTATNMVFFNATSGQVFYNISGNGVLKNKISATETLYPIGSGNTYSPVKVSNSGTADAIAVGVKTGFDYPVGDASKVVNKQYTVVPSTAGVTNLAISSGWVTASQGSGFNPAGPLVQGRYNAGVWSETNAALSGSGTIATPYYAKVSGNTNFGTFVVANTSALKDVIAPNIIQPEDITAFNTADACSADISFSAVATDNFSVNSLKYYLNYTFPNQQEITFPRTFEVGSYVVTVVAKDLANNTTTKTFTISVKDSIAPVVVTKPITTQLDVNGFVSIAAIDLDNGSSDACGGLTFDVTKESFDCSNVGSNTVTLTVTDVNGNVTTSDVIVTVEDKIAPLVVTKPITIQLDAQGHASIAANAVDNGSSDACGDLTFNVSKTSFDCSNIGENTVMLTVTDKNGNSATETAVVTVEDKVAPKVVTKSITIKLDATGHASITATDVNDGSSDACGDVTLNVSKTSFDCSNVGSNTLTLTVTDKNGNSAIGLATVTVKDEEAPVIVSLPSNISQFNDRGVCGAKVSWIEPTATDNCSVPSIVQTEGPANGTQFPVGTTTVTYKATDASGNTALKSFDVTITDNEAPVVTLVANPSVTLINGAYSLKESDVIATKVDNCNIQGTNVPAKVFTCSDIGSNVISVSVKDIHGNIFTANVNVKVVGAIPNPSITVSRTDNTYTGPGTENTVFLGYGTQTLQLHAVNTTSSQVNTTYAWSPTTYLNASVGESTTFTPTNFAAGNNKIMVTATNEYGCIKSTDVVLTVVDARCGNDKILVCNKPDAKNPQTWENCISANAVPALLEKGATLGNCPNVLITAASPSNQITEMVLISEPALKVYPTVNRGQFSVELTNYKASKATVMIVGVNGNIITKKEVTLTGAGSQTMKFDISNEAQGMYLIKVVGIDNAKTQKIVVER